MTTNNIISIGKGIFVMHGATGLVFRNIARSRADFEFDCVIFLFRVSGEYRLDRLEPLSAQASFMYALQHHSLLFLLS